MKIGIIGTGRMGSALGQKWASRGHQVMFGSRDPNKAKELANSVGANASAGTIAEAVKYGDAILFAVPYGAATETVQAAESWAGKIVMDCTNPVNFQTGQMLTSITTSGAEQIAEMAKGAIMIKAFNHMSAQEFADPRYGDLVADAFYAGDDDAAKATVAGLIKDMDFVPIDMGPLANARALESMAQLWIHLAFRSGWGPRIAWKILRK